VSTVEKNVKSRVFSRVLFTDETPRGGCFMNLKADKQTKHGERKTVVPKNNFLRRRATKNNSFLKDVCSIGYVISSVNRWS
jgi:hypothetical protein